MPTVLRINGLRVVIYTNDHRPAHVHVIGASGEAVIIIGAAATLVRVNGFSNAEVSFAVEIVEANAGLLTAAWEEIHGRRD